MYNTYIKGARIMNEECEHLEEVKNDSEYMGRPVTELIYVCGLDCDHGCKDCDGEGHYTKWGQDDD